MTVVSFDSKDWRLVLERPSQDVTQKLVCLTCQTTLSFPFLLFSFPYFVLFFLAAPFLFCLFCWPLIPLIVRSQTSKKTMNVKIAGSKGSGCLPHIPFPLCPLFGSFPSSLSFLAFHHFHFFCLLFLFFPFVSRFVKVKWTRHQRKRKTCCCLRRAATKKNIVCV